MILVISSDAELCRRVASRTGHSVIYVPFPDAGLTRLASTNPSLVVCDASGDGRAGVLLFHDTVRAAWEKSIPVLMITGWRDVIFEKTHFLNQASAPCSVLFRPFDDVELIEAANQLLKCGERKKR